MYELSNQVQEGYTTILIQVASMMDTSVAMWRFAMKRPISIHLYVFPYHSKCKASNSCTFFVKVVTNCLCSHNNCSSSNYLMCNWGDAQKTSKNIFVHTYVVNLALNWIKIQSYSNQCQNHKNNCPSAAWALKRKLTSFRVLTFNQTQKVCHALVLAENEPR